MRNILNIVLDVVFFLCVFIGSFFMILTALTVGKLAAKLRKQGYKFPITNKLMDGIEGIIS